jgi:hypothetical protein
MEKKSSSIVFISAKFQCIYLEWTWEIAKLRVAKTSRNWQERKDQDNGLQVETIVQS